MEGSNNEKSAGSAEHRKGSGIKVQPIEWPNLSGLTGGEPTLPNAQMLGEQVQGKPSPASPRRGRNHGSHLGVGAGARAGKKKLIDDQIFLFLH